MPISLCFAIAFLSLCACALFRFVFIFIRLFRRVVCVSRSATFAGRPERRSVGCMGNCASERIGRLIAGQQGHSRPSEAINHCGCFSRLGSFRNHDLSSLNGRYRNEWTIEMHVFISCRCRRRRRCCRVAKAPPAKISFGLKRNDGRRMTISCAHVGNHSKESFKLIAAASPAKRRRIIDGTRSAKMRSVSLTIFRLFFQQQPKRHVQTKIAFVSFSLFPSAAGLDFPHLWHF